MITAEDRYCHSQEYRQGRRVEQWQRGTVARPISITSSTRLLDRLDFAQRQSDLHPSPTQSIISPAPNRPRTAPLRVGHRRAKRCRVACTRRKWPRSGHTAPFAPRTASPRLQAKLATLEDVNSHSSRPAAPESGMSPSGLERQHLRSHGTAAADGGVDKSQLAHPEPRWPQDAKEAIGHGIRAKRLKSGAVSFDLLVPEGSPCSGRVNPLPAWRLHWRKRRRS